MVCLNHWKHLINSCCTDYHIKRHKQIGTPEFCFQSSVYTCICTISSIIRLNQWSFFPKTMKYLIDLNIQMCWFFVFLMYAVNPTIFFPNSQNYKNVIQHTLVFINPKSVIFLNVTLILIMNFYIYIDASFHANLYEINRSMWR